MPKVKMIAGIAAISGKFGNMYFRTDKKSGRVSLCHMPKKTTATLTDKQRAHQERFAAIAKMVQRMQAGGTKKSRKQLWKMAKEAYDAANQ